MPSVRNFDQLYDVAKNEVVQSGSGLDDFSEGSILDILSGLVGIVGVEVTGVIVSEFAKTFFNSSHGQDLDNLAVDQFGESFARLGAQLAIGIVEFSRVSGAAGDVVIPGGTIVTTRADASGRTERFRTVNEVVMRGTSVNASIESVEAGPRGNVAASAINNIENTLTDSSVTVSNPNATSGGANPQSDDEYRAHIKNLINALTGATRQALKAKALSVPGVEFAETIEQVLTVREWSHAEDSPVGDPFRIARSRLYISDANGMANNALIQQVKDALQNERASGVKIEILGAVVNPINWRAEITLNPGGPNFREFENNLSKIREAMEDYLSNLSIGEDFVTNLADYRIMQVWGPSGTNDLRSFTTQAPAANISIDENQKVIPGTIEVT